MEKLDKWMRKLVPWFYVWLLGVAFGYAWAWNALN